MFAEGHKSHVYFLVPHRDRQLGVQTSASPLHADPCLHGLAVVWASSFHALCLFRRRHHGGSQRVCCQRAVTGPMSQDTKCSAQGLARPAASPFPSLAVTAPDTWCWPAFLGTCVAFWVSLSKRENDSCLVYESSTGTTINRC